MLGPTPGDLLCPLLLTKLVSPLSIRLSSPRPTGLCFPYSLPHMYASGCVHHAYQDPPVSRLIHMHQVACTTPIKTLL